MNNKIGIFNPSGIIHLTLTLGCYDQELHPIFLSSLINFLGQNKGQLPTKKNEDFLLKELKKALDDFVSTETIIRTQKILTLTRKKRMYENSLALIRKTQKNNKHSKDK